MGGTIAITRFAKVRQTILPSSSTITPILFTAFLLLYNLFFITYSLQKHAAFQTAGFDLGIWDQMVWNTLHGRLFWMTQHNDIISGLGDHVEFILLLVYPLYGLYNGPETLLVFQSVLVSLGAFPIYLMARERLNKSDIAGLVFTLVYLLYPALQSAVLFDVHSLTIAVPFLAYALWAMYTGKYRLFAIMAVLVISSKEDMSLLVFMMGLYIFVVKRNIKVGLLTAGGGIAWFLVAIYIIIPTFRPGGGNEYVYRYTEWGDTQNVGVLIYNVISHPLKLLQVITAGDKAFYWVRLTMPVFFTALLDPFTMLLAAPTLLINTLSNYPASYQLDLFHSSAPLAVYVSYASINGVAHLLRFVQPKFRHINPRFLQNLILFTILLVTLFYQVQFGYTPIGRYFKWPSVTDRHLKIEQILTRIPSGVVVAAENNLIPRLSHRQWIFVLPDVFSWDIQPDYIFMDMQGNLDLHKFIELYCSQIDQILANPDYGLILADDGLLLFKRGVDSTAIYKPSHPCSI